MRRTHVVIALVVSSVLLLQAPAWAPKLYSAEQSGGQTTSPANRSRNTATVKVTSDCNNQDVTITFDWGETEPATGTKKASATGSFTVKPDNIPKSHGKVEMDDVAQFTCDGVLAFTGTSSVHLLVFGVSLLVAGTLLVFVTRRQRRPVPRQG